MYLNINIIILQYIYNVLRNYKILNVLFFWKRNDFFDDVLWVYLCFIYFGLLFRLHFNFNISYTLDVGLIKHITWKKIVTSYKVKNVNTQCYLILNKQNIDWWLSTAGKLDQIQKSKNSSIKNGIFQSMDNIYRSTNYYRIFLMNPLPVSWTKWGYDLGCHLFNRPTFNLHTAESEFFENSSLNTI